MTKMSIWFEKLQAVIILCLVVSCSEEEIEVLNERRAEYLENEDEQKLNEKIEEADFIKSI